MTAATFRQPESSSRNYGIALRTIRVVDTRDKTLKFVSNNPDRMRQFSTIDRSTEKSEIEGP